MTASSFDETLAWDTDPAKVDRAISVAEVIRAELSLASQQARSTFGPNHERLHGRQIDTHDRDVGPEPRIVYGRHGGVRCGMGAPRQVESYPCCRWRATDGRGEEGLHKTRLWRVVSARRPPLSTVALHGGDLHPRIRVAGSEGDVQGEQRPVRWTVVVSVSCCHLGGG